MKPNRIFINGFSCYATEPSAPSQSRGEEVAYLRADKVMEILKNVQAIAEKDKGILAMCVISAAFENTIKQIEAL